MTYCPKCEKEIKSKAKFCHDCGTELKSKKEEKIEKEEISEKPKQEKGNSYIWLWIILGLVLIVGVIAVSTGRISVWGSGITQYTPSKTCRDVQVPYEEQEEYMKTEYYTDSVPYTDRECEAQNLVYKVARGDCQDRQSGLFGLGDQPAKYSCIITNLDSEGGTFSMLIGFNSVDGQKLQTTSSKYIYPQSSETFSYQYDAKINNCYCSENVPTKQVCRDVIKYKDVQKERQVTAYRPVTKYKTERKCG